MFCSLKKKKDRKQYPQHQIPSSPLNVVNIRHAPPLHVPSLDNYYYTTFPRRKFRARDACSPLFAYLGAGTSGMEAERGRERVARPDKGGGEKNRFKIRFSLFSSFFLF